MMGIDCSKVVEQSQILQNNDYGNNDNCYECNNSESDSDSTENDEISEEHYDSIFYLIIT